LREIRAFPQDKAPELEELAAMDLTFVVPKGNRKETGIQKVMFLVLLGRRLRKLRDPGPPIPNARPLPRTQGVFA